MPRLWDETIEAHRRAVRDATMETTAALVAEHGLRGVTMSRIAAETGVGRATLYKYFPDVDAILLAWHERQVGAHREQLAALRSQPGDPVDRLEAVLETYALMQHELATAHGTELAALLHRGPHVARAQQHVSRFIAELVREGAKTGALRDDVPPGELASFSLHALGSAGELPSKAAVRRIVGVTLDGLRR